MAEREAESEAQTPELDAPELDALAARCAALCEEQQRALERVRHTLAELRLALLHRPVRPAARAGIRRRRESASGPRLRFTERERQIARLLAEGRSNAAIAALLRISPHTARHHTERVLAKLGVRSRAEAGAVVRG